MSELVSMPISAKSSGGHDARSLVVGAESLMDSLPSLMSARASFVDAIANVDSDALIGSIPVRAKTSWLRRLAAGWRIDDTTEPLEPVDSTDVALEPSVERVRGAKNTWFVCGRATRR